ncbi:DUF1565 domain-containing protein [bacterium]|nr:DUF1565 domain-containing protein [bacterium]
MKKILVLGFYLVVALFVFSCSTKSSSTNDTDTVFDGDSIEDVDVQDSDEAEDLEPTDVDSGKTDLDNGKVDMDADKLDDSDAVEMDADEMDDSDEVEMDADEMDDSDEVEMDADEMDDSDVEVILCVDAICVSVDGDDATGTGSKTAPFKTIAKAIEMAVAGDEICVSAGDYNETLTLTKDNLTIKGGYTPVDFKRDVAHYSNADSYGVSDANITKIISSEEAVVTFDGTLDALVFEGFAVESTLTSGKASSAITVKSGNPVISYSTLTAGNPTGGTSGIAGGSMSAGVVIGAGSPLIHNNKTLGGEAIDTSIHLGDPTAVSAGLIIGEIGTLGGDSSATPEIYNNFIQAGDSKDEGTSGGNVGIGIYNNTGDVKIYGNVISAGNNKYETKNYGVILSKNIGVVIYNNIIEGGTGTGQKVSIYLFDVTTAKIYNNTLDCGTTTTSVGTAIKLSGKYSTPEIKNNLLFCSNEANNPVYEYNANQTTPFAPVFENNVIVGGSTGVSITGGNNTSDALYKTASNIYLSAQNVTDIGFVSYDPLTFAANDFHLTDASKDIDGKDITTAGDDLSAVFTADKDGLLRSVSWSVGAYELD